MVGQRRGAWDALDPDVRAGVQTGTVCLAFLVFVGIIFPTPVPVLALGAVLGALSALVAMGLVLVYRANRIINFAQGDLGGVSSVLTASLIAGAGWAFWPALLVGLAAGTALGGVVEVLVVRRFRTSPRLLLTVATIGIASIMQALQLFVPSWFGFRVAPQGFAQPLPWTIHWNPIVFQGGHILVLIVVPIVGFGLGRFFSRTRTGQAVRAVAESEDRAQLLGIPVARISTLVWVIAAALSALGATLRAPLLGVQIGTVLGPSLLLRALAAAVIGRMENLRVTFAAAVVLGMVENAVLWDTGRTLVTDGVLFFVIIAGLLLQRRGVVSRATERVASSWANIREVRPVPPELAGLPELRWARAVGVVAFVVAFVVFPLTLSTGRVNLAAFGLIVAMLGISLVILTGWVGQISLGQWAFAGFGGAAAGKLAQNGWDIFLTLAVAGLVGAAVAIALGLPALRIKGPFLAVATLAFSLASVSFFLNREFFGWFVPSPDRIARPVIFEKFDLDTDHTYYFFVLAFFVLVLFSVRSLRASRTGRALLAVRENANAAQAFGINLVRAQLTAFALSGFIAALAGGLLVYHQNAMFQSPLLPDNSLRLFSIVVVGGLGSVPGVVTGAAFFTFFDFFVKTPEIRLVTSGVGLLVILMALPGGLGQLIYDTRDRLLTRLANRRSLVVPSLVADLRVEALSPQGPAPP